MRKIFVFTLLLMFVFASTVFAADWSKYESGRNNIRLDGYDGQPGYVEFTDGDGTTLAYLWYSETLERIVWCSDDALDHTTTKLTDYFGMPVEVDRAHVVPGN